MFSWRSRRAATVPMSCAGWKRAARAGRMSWPLLEKPAGIARGIQQTTGEVILVEHGGLYPAVQRPEERGWISCKWGTSSNIREARFYSLTAAGRKQLVKETAKWKRLAAGIGRILGPAK